MTCVVTTPFLFGTFGDDLCSLQVKKSAALAIRATDYLIR